LRPSHCIRKNLRPSHCIGKHLRPSHCIEKDLRASATIGERRIALRPKFHKVTANFRPATWILLVQL
jgi:hypothetical protein